MIGLVLDLLLATALVGLAWRVLVAPELFEAVVVFITLGLLMAVAWARLAAPDIALAEAAIGAGLTGVLLLDTLRAMRPEPVAEPAHPPSDPKGPAWPSLAASIVLAGVLIVAVLALPREPGGLTAAVAAELPHSGVTQPVTAVLLNFRSYDTWLELAVLLIAVIGVLSLRAEPRLADPPPGGAGTVLSWLVGILVPVAVLVAGYLLWLGKTAAGGAFQAGVALGAAGVLMWLAGHRPLQREWQWRALLPLGFIGFMAVGIGVMTGDRALLEYPRAHAGTLILLIETAAAVSIGATMTALFIGLHFPPGDPASGRKGPAAR
jgi:multisubunit Na+/H+ antiporter MnhB subunit